MSHAEQNKQIPENVKESVTLLIGGTPEVLFVMSGGIALRRGDSDQPSQSISYKPTTIADPDLNDGAKYGYLGGIYRVLATEHLASIFPNTPIITNSRDHTTQESHAQVYKNALVKRGVNKSRIEVQEISESTRAEFKEMVKLSLKHNWKGPVALITNGYHIERSVLTFASLDLLYNDEPDFLEQLNEFRDKDIKVLFVDSEKVLGLVDPRYKKFFSTIKGKEPFADSMRLREIAEANGIEALEKNAYQKRF